MDLHLLIAHHNVSRLIDRLETEDLVYRAPCPADSQGEIVRTKLAGRSLLKRMWPVDGAAIQRAISGRLNNEEAEIPEALFGKLY